MKFQFFLSVFALASTATAYSIDSERVPEYSAVFNSIKKHYNPRESLQNGLRMRETPEDSAKYREIKQSAPSRLFANQRKEFIINKVQEYKAGVRQAGQDLYDQGMRNVRQLQKLSPGTLRQDGVKQPYDAARDELSKVRGNADFFPAAYRRAAAAGHAKSVEALEAAGAAPPQAPQPPQFTEDLDDNEFFEDDQESFDDESLDEDDE